MTDHTPSTEEREIREKLAKLHVYDQAGGYVPLDDEGVNDVMAVVIPFLTSTAKTSEAAVIAARIDEVQHMPHERRPEQHEFTDGKYNGNCDCYKGRRLRKLADLRKALNLDQEREDG